MKTAFSIAALAVLLVVPSRSFAVWGLVPVSKERAKGMGLEVRSEPASPNHVWVQLEFKTEGKFEEFGPKGKFKDRSRVELRIGNEANPPVSAPLREDRSKPGRVVVGFTADRAHIDKINLWVMVPESLGGTTYILRVKDFVEPEPPAPPDRPRE